MEQTTALAFGWGSLGKMQVNLVSLKRTHADRLKYLDKGQNVVRVNYLYLSGTPSFEEKFCDQLSYSSEFKVFVNMLGLHHVSTNFEMKSFVSWFSYGCHLRLLCLAARMYIFFILCLYMCICF